MNSLENFSVKQVKDITIYSYYLLMSSNVFMPIIEQSNLVQRDIFDLRSSLSKYYIYDYCLPDL